MTSSTLSGDRRRPSSAKRSGLTVLGKVVVPKPINLPSQRSENHGSDPKVEIVPMGTLGWGGKSSSPWGSSSLSHNIDGGGDGSPSHLSGHPSSGSGTRPSTASSDRAHEPTTNVCGPNSRPSSASGALTSSQTSLIALRPHSAETRPCSSQLSRFAEHSEQVAGNADRTAEKLQVVTPSKNHGFSLTSRDFPTLGSAKENSDKSSCSRPGSSSSGLGTTKERIETSGASNISARDDVKNSTVNSWKRDSPPYFEDGGRPGMEKWQGNPQNYPTLPQHYDAWRGAPLHNPQGGVWFRGPPGGPYGNLAAPAGYPMEPIPYYCPQIPTACLPNPLPVLPSLGVGPRGPHPKNGDMYRPHMSDAFIGPCMRIRPDFYPGPFAYEGYYGPPIGYCSSNERDAPFVGMASGPSIYNVYSGQRTLEPGNSQGRSSEYGFTNQTKIGEQVESIHTKDNQGPDKVLLKQHDSDDRKTEEHRSESVVATDASRGDHPRTFWEDDWRSYKKDEGRDSRKSPVEEASLQNSDNKGAPLVPEKVKSPGIVGNIKAIPDISGKKLESESIGLLTVPQPLIAAPKDTSLIQKIERLNAKARASDESKATIASSGEDQNKKVRANIKVMQNRNESSGGSSYLETCTTEISNSITQKVGMSAGDKNLDTRVGTKTNMSRRSTHSSQSRDDHYGRGRINTQEAEGRKEPSISESAAVLSTVHLEASNIHVQDRHHGSTENSGLVSLSHGKFEGQSVLPMFDRSNDQSQRAKMKELVKQKAKQLQEEEEERNKKQIARAFAKLEELNRRTQAIEGSTQKLENSSSGIAQNKKEVSQPSGESSIGDKIYGMPKTVLGSKSNVVAQANEGCTSGVENSCLSLGKLPSEAPKSVSGEPVKLHAQSMPLQQEIIGAIASHDSRGPQAHESKVSKEKRTSFKQRQTTLIEAPKTQADIEDNVTSLGVVANEVLSSGGLTVTVKVNANADFSVHPRKKNSKNGKNKHKIEDASALSTSSSLGSKENLGNFSVESSQSQPKASDLQLNPSAVQLQTISRDAYRSAEQYQSSPNEDSHGRVNSQWKPQQSRRVPRNPQGNRPSEKFHGSDVLVVWAPVRSQTKTEVTVEANRKNGVDGVDPSVKSHPQAQNNLKNKRAEMERYVPKPVAKELAQHGGNYHPMTSAVDIDGSIGRDNSESTCNTMMVAGEMGFSVEPEPQNGISRNNKQGEAQGSWRQRVSAKSTSIQVLQDAPSYTINHGQDMQKLNAREHLQNPDSSSMNEQQKCTTDDWGISNNSVSVEPIPVPAVKDQGVAVRVKRHGFKGHKSMLNNHDLDQKKISSAENDKSFTQSSTSEMSQTERSVVSKEIRVIGERSMSHWQPKTQAVSTGHQRENRHNICQNVGAEVVLTNKLQSIRHDGVLPPPTHVKVTNDSLGQIHCDQPVSGRNNAEDASRVRQQEPRRESKSDLQMKKPHFPYQGPVNPVDPLPVNFDARQEQHKSGFRKRGNQNSMLSKSQDSRGDWNCSVQDTKQQNPPSNRGRSGRNLHYEYQPVGSYGNKFSNYDGPKDGIGGSSGSGARVWGRGGQSHSRRGGGNFIARQSGV